MDHLEYCDALEVEIDRFATVFEGVNGGTMVPTCPKWSVHDLAEHLGHVHRWAEHLVRVRAKERVPSAEMDFERGPVSAPWIRSGGESLLVTLRSGDPDEAMWAGAPTNIFDFGPVANSTRPSFIGLIWN